MPSPIRSVALPALTLLALFTSPAGAGPPELGAYNTKITFAKDRVLRFPDFEVTYVGKRRITPPQYPRGWWAYDFTVRSRSGEQTISWSAGTGDIAPTRFKIERVEFQIELSRSDKLGHLREDELVVSKVTQD